MTVFKPGFPRLAYAGLAGDFDLGVGGKLRVGQQPVQGPVSADERWLV